MTFGASLGLTIAGTIISAAGGITAAGANIGYSAVSSHSLKHAKEAVENDQKVLEEFKKLNDELARIIDSLAEKHPSIKKDEIHKMLFDCACLGKTCAMAIWCGYKMIDGFFDVGRNIATITGQSASAAARTTIWAGMNTAKQVVNVAGAALDVVTIPIDLFVMIKASIDVHKFRTTGESNSNVARKIGGFITQLEEHRDELKRQCGIE